jgi:hypothetical protein
LKFGHQAFETKNITKKEERLQNEVKRLKGIIGDLTGEFKKTITIFKTEKIRSDSKEERRDFIGDSEDKIRASPFGISQSMGLS